MRLTFRNGLDVAVPGAPRQVLGGPVQVNRVGLVGTDYGLTRLDILVAVGDRVARGTPVLRDRKRPQIVVTAPASGVVEDIAMGARRRLSALMIAADGDEAVAFDTDGADHAEGARALLQQAGLWSALRARPFDRIPDPMAEPVALFVTAMDTRPHAVDARLVLKGAFEDFSRGLAILARAVPAPLYVCHAPGTPKVPGTDQIISVEITGRHPAGLPGTHIHHLMPASRGLEIWHIHYQDVIAIGHLARTGTLPTTRTIAFSGAGVAKPRLIDLPAGADLFALAQDHGRSGKKRVLSGSPLDGRESRFLSRYHWQATLLADTRDSQTASWLVAALRRAAAPAPFIPTRGLDLASGTRLPIVALLRAISVGDVDGAARLGALELGEDDLALATYVTGGATSFGRLLRKTLDTLEADR